MGKVIGFKRRYKTGHTFYTKNTRGAWTATIRPRNVADAAAFLEGLKRGRKAANASKANLPRVTAEHRGSAAYFKAGYHRAYMRKWAVMSKNERHQLSYHQASHGWDEAKHPRGFGGKFRKK